MKASIFKEIKIITALMMGLVLCNPVTAEAEEPALNVTITEDAKTANKDDYKNDEVLTSSNKMVTEHFGIDGNEAKELNLTATIAEGAGTAYVENYINDETLTSVSKAAAAEYFGINSEDVQLLADFGMSFSEDTALPANVMVSGIFDKDYVWSANDEITLFSVDETGCADKISYTYADGDIMFTATSAGHFFVAKDSGEGLRQTELKSTVNGYTITATGNMPKGAELSAVRVYNTNELEEIINNKDYSVYVAFDIEILVDGEVWQPVEHEESVSIDITGIDIPEDQEVKVYRIENEAVKAGEAVNDDSVVELDATLSDDGNVVVETDHFTTYTIGTTTLDADTTAYLLSGKDFNEAIKRITNASATYETEDNDIISVDFTDEAFTSDVQVQQNGAPVYARNVGGYTETKYSHTSNVDDTGLKVSNYGNGWNNSNILGSGRTSADNQAHVVTIPGAETLTVDLYYNGESTSYDWVSVWAGTYPSYTAVSNYGATGKVTSAMGAPNDSNKFGGSQNGTYTVNGNNLTSMGHCTLTIPGDSVTFAFKSDSSGAGNGYGYYAIVEAEIGDPDGTGYVQLYSPAEKVYLNEDSSYMLYNLKSLTNTGFVNDVDNSLVKNYNAFFKNDGSIEELDLESWDVQTGTSFAEMFANCELLKKITAFNKIGNSVINLPSVANKNWYIDNNNDLVADSKTAMTAMTNNTDESNTYVRDDFVGFSLYTAARLADGKTVNQKIKRLCSSYASYTTENQTIKHILFTDTAFTSSTTLQESGLPVYARYISGTGTVELYTEAEKVFLNSDSSYLFYNLTGVVTLPVVADAKLDVSAVQNYSYMFSQDAKLESFGENESGAETGVMNWNTTSAQNMSHMFDGCSFLIPDTSGFDVSGVTDFSYMFNNCSSIISFEFSDWDTSSAINMSYFIAGCSNVENLYGYKSLDVSNVNDFSYLMSECTHLEYIDVSEWDVSSGIIFEGMFNKLVNVTYVKAPKTIPENVKIPMPTRNWVIDDDNDGTADDAIRYNIMKAGITDQSHKYIPGIWDVAYLKPGKEISALFKQLKKSSATYYTPDSNITCIKWTDVPFESTTQLQEEGAKVYAKLEGTEILVYTNVDTVYLNQNSGGLFYWFQALRNIPFIEKKINTSGVTNFSNMFYSCSGLTSLDVSNFDTSSGTNFYNMFEGCKSLTSLDLSSFDTSNGTDFGSMFASCNALTSLDLSSFDTSNGTDFSCMFSGCWVLTSLDVSGFDTSKGVRFDVMFANCQKLTNLDVSSFDTSNGTNFRAMFAGCNGLTSLDVSGFDTLKSTNFSQMFEDCSSLTNLDLSGFDTSNGTDFSYMFENCSSLTNLVLNSIDTSKSTSFRSMFDGCSGLTSLDVSNFDTTGGTTFYRMFNGCNNLTSLDVSGFNTSNGTNFGDMFNGCTSLTSLNVSNFNTSKGTNFEGMFYNCSTLTSLNVSNFNTSKGTNFSSMFKGCSKLTSLDVSNFDTSKGMDFSYMFDMCISLENLNASSMTVNANAGTTLMILYCDSLTTFNAPKTISKDKNISLPSGNWTIDDTFDGVSDTGEMYGELVNDISEKSHRYIKLNTPIVNDDENINYSILLTGADFMAKINRLRNDDGKYEYDIVWTDEDISTNSASVMVQSQGLPVWAIKTSYHEVALYTTASKVYFNNNSSNMFKGAAIRYVPFLNDKIDTSNVVNFSYMFYCCYNLTSLNLSNFDTSNGTNFGNMFNSCSKLTSLDVSSFNTSNGTNFSEMFYKCSKLTNLDLSNFDTSNGTNFSSMFEDCKALASLVLSSFDTSNGTDFSHMFDSCSALTSLDLSNFSTPKGTDFRCMFDGCSALTSLDLSNLDTSKGTGFDYMFDGCSALTSLDVSNFNTSSATRFNYMFSGCSALTSLDLSNFNTSKGMDFSYMLYNCNGLIKIISPPNSPTISPIELPLPLGSWGWDDNNDGIMDNETRYRNITGNETIPHIYIKGNIYTVSFEVTNNDEIIIPDQVFLTSATSTVTIPVISKKGWEIKKWYTNEALTNEYDFTQNVTSSFTLYGKIERQKFTITFDPDGGAIDGSTTKTVVYGDIYGPLPTPEKENLYFKGWYTPEGVHITRRNTVLLLSDITFTAEYASEPVYFNVSFETDGGSSADAQNILFGGLVAEPAVVKENYALEGWYYDSNMTIPWDFATDTVDGDTVLYAKWALVSTYTFSLPAVINMTDIYNSNFAGQENATLARYGSFDIHVEGTGGSANDFKIGIECGALNDGNGHSAILDGYQQIKNMEKDEEFTSSDISDYPNSFTGDDPAMILQRLDSTYYKTIVLNGNDFKFTDNVLLHGIFPAAIGEYNGNLTVHFGFVPKNE